MKECQGPNENRHVGFKGDPDDFSEISPGQDDEMIALVRRTQTTRRTVSRNDRIGQTDTDNWSNPIMTFRKGGSNRKSFPQRKLSTVTGGRPVCASPDQFAPSAMIDEADPTADGVAALKSRLLKQTGQDPSDNKPVRPNFRRAGSSGQPKETQQSADMAAAARASLKSAKTDASPPIPPQDQPVDRPVPLSMRPIREPPQPTSAV